MAAPSDGRSGVRLALGLASVLAVACSAPVVAPTPRPVAPGAPAGTAAPASAPAEPSSAPASEACAPVGDAGAPVAEAGAPVERASGPGVRARRPAGKAIRPLGKAVAPRGDASVAVAPANEAKVADRAPPAAGLRAYWVGHATVLVAMGDKWIITDPNFSDRVGLFARRKVKPGIDLDALPAIDWILVSHGHFDHLDKRSLRRLSPAAAVATPPGVARFVPKGRFKEVVSLAEWHSVERDGMCVTAVPVRHGDGRYGVDSAFRRGSHTGFVVEYQGLTIFFAGDTAYDDRYFKEIGRRFRIDVALVPIGPVGVAPVQRFMRTRHADPADGLRILADVGARWMIPIHHGTFFTGGKRELDALEAAVRRSPVGSRVQLLQPGEAFTLPSTSSSSSPSRRR
jgi:N-acyl-phosphatidylethanolamine-hydrolysing phospholipase D